VLLAVLLMHANEAVTSDRLIDALWGESPPPTAPGSLHNLVSGLRKAVGDGRLVTRDGGYLLCVADDELDAHRFDALAERGRRALVDGEAEPAAALLREGLALWRGPAFADLAYEPALQSEAARLEDRRLAALEDRIEADLACGRHAALVAELAALTAQHPFRERLLGQHMCALYRSGRQADALQVYADARRKLVDELGIEPGPELRGLQQSILDQDPTLAAPAGARVPGTPRPFAARLRRRPVPLLAAGLALLLAALGAVLVVNEGGGHHGLGSLVGNSVAAIDPGTNRVIAEVPLGGTPTSVSATRDAVWALNADDQTITRIDAGTKRRVVFAVGATPTDLVAGERDLWVGSGVAVRDFIGVGTSDLLRVDVDSRTVRRRIVLPSARAEGANGAPGQLAVGAGAVWAINKGGELARVDPLSGRVTARLRTLRIRAVSAGAGSVWAIDADSPTAVRLDPSSAAIRARVKLGTAQLDTVAVGAGAVWLTDSYAGTLWRIDPGARAITRTIEVGIGADGVAVGAGSVWVTNSLRGTLVRVDPRRNRIVATVPVGNTPRDVAVGAGAVWVTLAGAGEHLPAAGASNGRVSQALPQERCGRLFAAAGPPPDRLIVSDLPLQSGPLQTQPIANAVAFVLRQHRFRAGRYRLGYQSCDSSTAESGSSDPRKCAANAKAYAATGAVIGMIAPLESACARVTLPIANRAPGGPLALVSGSNSDVGLTQHDPTGPPGALRRLYPTGARNYVRVFPAADSQAAADALLARQLGLRRPYLLVDGTPYGRQMAHDFGGALRALGLPLAGAGRWNPLGAGLAAVAARVARARADGAFLAGFLGSNGGTLTRALRRRLGRGFALIATDAFGPVSFLYDDSHGAAKGMFISIYGVPNERLGTRGEQFLREFGSTQHAPVGSYAVHAAAATEVLLDAIARSDGTRASVSRALLATRLNASTIGPVRFDRNGDLIAPSITIVRVRDRDGVSQIEAFEGAAFDRVIRPPARIIP
jgi:YVTN family beta-propeller protein